ncbi:MAG: hypothetical protein JW759_02155 [Candidatus Coatesbacteria bacterium]|nr:hypothetical protein [Candidatus Coatesbacteria bacterium]
MTVSLQYIHRIYGDELRKIELGAKAQEGEPKAEQKPESDTVHISESARRSILTSDTNSTVSGSMLQRKLAIEAYQKVAKGLPSMLK